MSYFKLMQNYGMRERMYAADGGAGGGAGGSAGADGADDAGGADDADDSKGGADEKKDGAKTFTQEEVNVLLRKEKVKVKRSIYKDLFNTDDADEVKTGIDKVKGFLSTDTKKNEKTEEKPDTEKIKAIQEKEKAEKKAALIQFKLDAIKKGVSAKHVDDFAVLAISKITDEADAEDVIDELMKTYPFMCVESETEESKGTGKGGTQKKGKDAGTGYAARLIENSKNTTGSDSFFKM